MIEQKAKVISHDDGIVWVEAERTSTCSACKVKKGCGTGMLSEHVGKRFSRISVSDTHSDKFHAGQEVQLSIPEEALLEGAFLMYIVPLLFLFIGAGLGQLIDSNRGVEIIFGLAGLLIGFIWVKHKLRTRTENFKAKIVEE